MNRHVIFAIRSGKQGTLKMTLTVAIVFYINTLSACWPIVAILVYCENPFFQHSFFIIQYYIIVVTFVQTLYFTVLKPPSQVSIPCEYFRNIKSLTDKTFTINHDTWQPLSLPFIFDLSQTVSFSVVCKV